MKRFILSHKLSFSAIWVFITSSGCFAQADFKLDIHAGLAGTQVQGDGLGGFDKLGVMGGLGVHTAAFDKFDLGLELNIVEKGSVKRANPEAGDLEKYKMRLFYVQVPIYARYNVNDKIGVLAGPSLAALISSREEDLNGEIQNNPDFEPFELAAIIGVHYRFTEKFKAEIRLDQSLSAIRKKGEGRTSRLVGRQYNTSLGFYLYYSLGT